MTKQGIIETIVAIRLDNLTNKVLCDKLHHLENEVGE